MDRIKSHVMGGIQLPDDAKIIGYRASDQNSFEFDTIYQSGEFTGTENDFLNAGLAYRFRQIDNNTRIII